MQANSRAGVPETLARCRSYVATLGVTGAPREVAMNAQQLTVGRFAPVALAALAWLGACESGPRLRSSHDPGADFGSYRTYGFIEPLGTDRSGYATIVSSTLRAAASAELEKRGYRPSDAPDLLVNFHARLTRRHEVTAVPAPGPAFYYSYRYGYYAPWGGYDYETLVRDYTEGTLNVDLVDRARKQLVWEGIAIGEVTEKKVRDPAGSLPPVVARIFSEYPYVAGQALPVDTRPPARR
jgi:hypothetical protein